MLNVSAQTKRISKHIAPSYSSSYDGGYGAIMPQIIENQIINDSQVIQKTKGWGEKEENTDTISINWIRDKYNVNSCDMYKKFFSKVTYCYLDAAETSNGSVKQPKKSKSGNTLLYFILGGFALYPICKKIRV